MFMKELLSMKMEKKEKLQDLNQRFTTLLNSFSAATKPTEESLVDYYATTLHPPIAMFIVKATLVENYEEAKKVEADLDSIARHTVQQKLKTIASKNPLLLTRPKEEHSNELENVVKMVQK